MPNEKAPVLSNNRVKRISLKARNRQRGTILQEGVGDATRQALEGYLRHLMPLLIEAATQRRRRTVTTNEVVRVLLRTSHLLEPHTSFLMTCSPRKTSSEDWSALPSGPLSPR